MKKRLVPYALGLALASAVAVAQSPGSVESELNYAREYMDAGKWDYAMWRYEGILRQHPDNEEAQAGYEKAKAAHEAKEAAKAAKARELSSPAPRRNAPAAPSARKTGPQSTPGGSARAMCDEQFGTCQAIYKSVAACAPKRAMCYTQNGVKW